MYAYNYVSNSCDESDSRHTESVLYTRQIDDNYMHSRPFTPGLCVCTQESTHRQHTDRQYTVDVSLTAQHEMYVILVAGCHSASNEIAWHAY